MAIQTLSRETKQPPGLSKLGWRPKRGLNPRDRMFFTEQLSLMLETGANLHTALQTMLTQTSDPAIQKVIRQLTEDLANGASFSHALSQHPTVFSSTYTNLIAAGEQGGFVPQVLQQLLEMDEKRDKLKNTLISAFSYPAFLLFFSVGVVVFILVMVFPKFASMFANITNQLPASTLILMQLSDWVRGYWPQILMGMGFLGGSVVFYCNSDHGRKRIDHAKLFSPGLRNIFVPLYLLQSLRTMSLSLANGVSVLDTLTANREVVKNSAFGQWVTTVEDSVKDGRGITPAFEQANFLPSLVPQLIATGETSGSLAKVMGRLADHYERELSRKLDAFSKIAEPLMLLFMGLVVGVVVSSLILPIFKLSKAVT